MNLHQMPEVLDHSKTKFAMVGSCYGNYRCCSKKACVNWSREMFKKFIRSASKHVDDIVTGDKSWIYAYVPKSKLHSIVWMLKGTPNPIQIVRARSTSKQMLVCFLKKNWAGDSRTTRITQNSKYWWGRYYFLASCLSRNVENLLPKTDHFLLPHRELSYFSWSNCSVWAV